MNPATKEKMETIDEDCFGSPVVITGKKQLHQNCTDVRKLNESCIKKIGTPEEHRGEANTVGIKPQLQRDLKKPIHTEIQHQYN